MMLEIWRPRSAKVRFTAWVTLATLLTGPAGLASAAPPVAPATTKATGPAAAPPPPAKPADKLPTDTPWALPTRLPAARITVLSGAVDAAAVALAFDERAGTGLSAGDRPIQFRMDLEAPAYIDAVAIWDKVDGALTIETDGPKGHGEIVSRASLAGGSAGWNRRDAATPPLATSVTVTLEPARGGATLRELEIWGRPTSMPDPVTALLPDALYTSVPAGARAHAGAPQEQTISPSTVSRPGIGGMFSVKTDVEPRDVGRAFLVYELSGQPHFSAAARAINGQRALGHFGTSRGAKGGLQVEEIDPSSLKKGGNWIQFLPADDHDPTSYRVRNLRVVTVRRSNATLSDAGARSWEAVRDGREATGWKAASGKPAAERSWSFASVSQPWALDLRLPQKGVGTLTIASRSGDDQGKMTVRLDDLSAGWHRVPLNRLPRTGALAFTLTGGKELAAEISELAIEASPVPADEAPRVTITYPLSGECVNGRVHVRGFLTPAGAQSLSANGGRQDSALDRGGAFAFDMDGKDVAGTDVAVEAAYADGRRARQTVAIGRCVDRPPVVVADDGRPRQPVDDTGAPFGVTVRAGQGAALVFDGMKLDIPEGAVEKDVRITIRPLPTKDVAPLDPGMTNVTPTAKAFRFGPLGMVFKKPVKMTVPFDRKLIPAGLTPEDVRTFYYDEAQHRWQHVGIVSQGDRELVVASDHFTDFVNATIPMPENPGTQSNNPTSLKDIKLADPAAGITRIAPPTPSATGSASLQFPIVVPPGRRGMQPNLALTYNSDHGNGWVGVGWDIQPSVIEVDTRFGVPKYQGEEVYLLDGAMLTPVPNKPGFYRPRDGGSFDIIERIGAVPLNFRSDCYYWKVTDKNGTVRVYGRILENRLYDSNLLRAAVAPISRWFLESVTDVFGNAMTYTYVRDVSPALSAPAAQLYLDKIQYTSNANAGVVAPYTVKFVRTTVARPDAFTSARSGFLVLTRHLLDRIEVSFSGSGLIRSYRLRYISGRFGKQLLSSIDMMGTDGTTILYTYRFDYKGTTDGEIVVNDFFAQPVVWGQLQKQQPTNMSLRPEDGLSKHEGDMWGLNINGGISVLKKVLNIRIGGGVTDGSDTGHMIPFDLNGDGLPDFVDDSNGINLNSPSSSPSRFRVMSSADVMGTLSHTNRSGWNIEGSLGAGFKNDSVGAGASLELAYARNTAEDDRIVSDLDGDGYPDILQIDGKGKVTFLKNTATGVFSQQPPQAVSGLNATNRSVTVADWAPGNTTGMFPVHTVTRWIAPFAGTVTLTGPISLVPQDPPVPSDGVHVSLWRSGQTTPTWQADVGPNVSCRPSGTSGCDGSTPPKFTGLQGGERFYMVVEPKQNADGDVVSWNPTFKYDDFFGPLANRQEPYGAPVYQFSQQDDFRLAGLPWAAWQANADGKIELEIEYDSKSVSDNVVVSLLPPQTNTVVLSQGAVETQSLPSSGVGHTTTKSPTPITVTKGQKLVLQVNSDTQIDPARVGIKRALIRYTYFCRERGRNNPPACGDVVYPPQVPGVPGTVQVTGDTMRLPLNTVLRPITPYFPPHKTLPNVATQSFISPGGTVHISGSAGKTSNLPTAPGAWILIQGVNKLHKKVAVTSTAPVNIDFDILITTPDEEIFFTVLSQVSNTPAAVSWLPKANNQTVPVNRTFLDRTFNTGMTNAAGQFTTPPDPFAGGYHGWYAGDWDGSQPFAQSALALPTAPLSQQSPKFMFCLPYDPLDFTDNRSFLCRGTNAYIAAGQLAPSFSPIGMGMDAQLRAFRLSETANVNLTAGASVSVGNVGGGVQAGVGVGSTKSTLDFLDLNGDRYPDSVSGGVVLYNDGKGHFSPGSNLGIGNLRSTSSRNVRAGISLGASDKGQLLNLTKANSEIQAVLSTKVGSGVDYGFSSNNVTLEDINGDGLPDQIIRKPNPPLSATTSDTMVRLNLGYRFEDPFPWTSPVWTVGDLDSINALPDLTKFLGADVGSQALSVSDSGSNNASFPLGVGNVGDVQNTTRTISRLLDVNGDGLLDEVLKKPGDNALYVKINLGTGFAPPTNWKFSGNWRSPKTGTDLNIKPSGSFLYPTSLAFLQNADTASYSIEEGWQASLGFEICIYIFCIAISGFVGAQGGWSQMDFEDINGDDRPDHVLKLDGDPNVYTKLNTVGNMDALVKVTGPLGDTIDLGYSPAGNYVDSALGVDMPSNHWVLSSVKTGDGRGQFYTDHINYDMFNAGNSQVGAIPSGHYDRLEREDYGFGHVEITSGQFVSGNWQEGDGSRIERFFYNQDFYRKGRLKAEFQVDDLGNLIRGSRIDIAAPPEADPNVPNLPNSVRTGYFFPQTEDSYTLFYEKRASVLAISSELTAATFAAPKWKKESRQMDDRGNLTSFIDYGDTQLPTSTQVDYTIFWTPFDAATNITRPSYITATAGANGAMLRKREAFYQPGKGVPNVIRNFVVGGRVPGSGTPGTLYDPNTTAAYTFSYDVYGNLETASDPSGSFKYTYDNSVHTYATRVDDQTLGYFSTADFDFRFGSIVASADVNRQPTSYTYDQFGRLCTVRGPDDQSASVAATIALNYDIVPSSCPNPVTTTTTYPAYAVTRHKDVQHAGDPIDTVTFIDGLGRVIQTKKDLDCDAAGTQTPQEPLCGGVAGLRTGMVVSGQVLFDGRGRVRAQGQPAFSTFPTTSLVMVPMNNPSLTSYDPIGRPLLQNMPDNTLEGIQTNTVYGMAEPSSQDSLGDGKTWLLTQVFDGQAFVVPPPPAPAPSANTGRHLSYADSRGNTIAVREFNQIGTATTLTPLTSKYVYDRLDQLLNVTDALGKVTSTAYDTVGQMVSLTSPDAGQTEYRFDLGGNLRERQTPNLRGQSRFITYAYDFHRLKTITYPTLPQVTYTYGAPTETGDAAGNVAGRVKKVTFEAGDETRTYDRLGNVNKTVTTLNRMAPAGGPPATMAFTMLYTYDWLGRMQNMTFPNWIDPSYQIVSGLGEKVTYNYDRGGNLDSITGAHQTPNTLQTSHPPTFPYLNHIGYSEFGQQTVFTSGNGIANKYVYEPGTRRLAQVNADSLGSTERSQNRPATPFHRLRYTYDKVGNVTRMTNDVSVRTYLNASVFVGPVDTTYTYDNQYQLRSMSSKYRPNVAYGYQSADTFTYDEIGNLKTKAQQLDRLVWDNQTVNMNDPSPVTTQLLGSRFDHPETAKTYTMSYQYTGTRPHATNSITETPLGVAASPRNFSYDADGNNTGNGFRGDNRVQTWDEEDRLKEVKLNGGSLAQFKYDDQGERRKRMTGTVDAWYVNQYFVLLPNNQPTKHIFAGTTRIATKTDPMTSQTPTLNYYHPDHLGTTSYTSVLGQDLVQHERYFAFGELWRGAGPQEETDLSRPGGARREWLFTGKEYDVDTNLYYFGARYFDPHTSVWQSTDPILSNYVARGAAGASPKNLGLYSYAWNNPIVIRDPDGRQIAGTVPEYPQAVARQAALDRADAAVSQSTEAHQHFLENKRALGDVAPGPGPLHTPILPNPIQELSDYQTAVGGERPMESDFGIILAIASLGTASGAAVLEAAASRVAVGEAGEGFLAAAGRFFYDPRNFRTISREYWAANGPANGRSLHHWLFPQSARGIPQGIRNAGFNLLELPAGPTSFTRGLGLNQWMGFAQSWGGAQGAAAFATENALRLGIPAAIGGAGYGGYRLGSWLAE